MTDWRDRIYSLDHYDRCILVDTLREVGRVDDADEADAIARSLDEDEREARWSRC